VANSGSSSLSVIEVKKQAVVKTLPLDRRPVRVEVVSSDSDRYRVVVW